jgi:hypothetical protein
MKKILLLLLLAATFIPLGSIAQKLSYAQQKQVDDLFKNRQVVYFKFNVRSMQEAQGLSKIISIDKAQGATFYAHATKLQFSSFITKNYAYTVTAPKKQVKKVAQAQAAKKK